MCCVETHRAWYFTRSRSGSRVGSHSKTTTSLSTVSYNISTYCLISLYVYILHNLTDTHTHTTVLLLFWNMSGTTRVSRYQKGTTSKGETNLDLLEQETVSGSGICWAMCKSAPHPRQPRQHPKIRYDMKCLYCMYIHTQIYLVP